MSDAFSMLGPWADARLTASWRGIPFAVRESEIKRGRRTAVHEYAMRDVCWVEDLGRATRVTSFRGFIVGDDVDDQLQAIIDAAEAPGEGTLVHPALGAMTGSLVEFAARDTAEGGRVWTLEFVFITSSERVFPGADADTQDIVENAADDAEAAEDEGFSSIGDSIASGIATAAQTVQGVAATVAYYGQTAQFVVHDVQASAAATAGLAGNFGRFSLGARLATVPGLANIAQAVAASNAAVGSVSVLAGLATVAAEAL